MELSSEFSMAPREIVIFSGGSAANSLVDVFNGLLNGQRSLSYIIGISDNGGSTSEILRVFGGPGIGDVRSRLIRLVPDLPKDKDRFGTKCLLNHRLSANSFEAKAQWLSIVEGTHELWRAISSEKRELIRSFLVFLHAELVKRGRPTSSFDFTSASVGNLFLTAVRIFTGSFESAVYMFGTITGVKSEVTKVIPAINSNFAHHIAAGLEDGTVIVGQNQISHPSSVAYNGYSTPFSDIHLPAPPTTPNPMPTPATWLQIPSPNDPISTPNQFAHSPSSKLSQHCREETIEDATLPYSLLSLKIQNILFTKVDEQPLQSRIERIWYINPYGQEIRPPANPKVLNAIAEAEAIIYSIGSLYTSLWPCLILRGVGQTISSSSKDIRFKILILNGSLDRETCKPPSPAKVYTATDFVESIVKACLISSWFSSFADIDAGVEISGTMKIMRDDIRREAKRYITHLIHLEGEGVPVVDATELMETFGIESVRVHGRRTPDGGGIQYDGKALGQALWEILGGDAKEGEEFRWANGDGC